MTVAVLNGQSHKAIKNQTKQKPQVENRTGESPKQQMTSLDYLREGSSFYQAKNYEKAVVPFQVALDLEKKERQLDKALWFMLIDNLAMSYGLKGDIKRSQEVVDYGIQQDPTYPFFYYIKACGFGQTEDEDNATKYLRLAFKNKDNLIKGETFPDPATDSSFKGLMKREKFQKAVAEMKNGD